MNIAPLNILLIEDNPGDARLLKEMLREADSFKADLTHCHSMRDGLSHMAEKLPNIILLDLGLPDADGLGAVRQLHSTAPAVPLVVLTGLDDEALATQALQEGAQDYLIKGRVEAPALLRSVRYAIERHRMQVQMEHSARHDLLTSLPNRLLLNDRITQSISLARRQQRRLAVMFLDLDHFKYVNDSLGHSVGDKLLRSVSKRLAAGLRSSDTVSRQGGDEFVILLSEMSQPKDAATSARKILELLNSPHLIGEHNLHIDGSIGISIFPDDGETAETLIQNADTAMYHAKSSGRNTFQFFTPEMNRKAVERLSIEGALRRAVEHEEFLLLYQPKVNLETGNITGVEALIRWQPPGVEMVSPAQFVPIAEDCGLILPIGRWVLGEACRQCRQWHREGLQHMTMAVNFSAIEFRHRDFIKSVQKALLHTGLEPDHLELEVTESVLMESAQSSVRLLHELRSMGVRIAVDDFGTGYSSLSYLRQFPLDALKIDQSFVQQITAESDSSTIVGAIINMAKTLRYLVIAEGIETTVQMNYLRAQGCTEGQGFLFSPPVAADEFVKLLQRRMVQTSSR